MRVEGTENNTETNNGWKLPKVDLKNIHLHSQKTQCISSRTCLGQTIKRQRENVESRDVKVTLQIPGSLNKIQLTSHQKQWRPEVSGMTYSKCARTKHSQPKIFYPAKAYITMKAE